MWYTGWCKNVELCYELYDYMYMHWMCSITSCSTLLHHSFILTITLHSLNTAIINICIHCIAPIAGNIFWIHTVHAVCLWNNVVNDWLSYSTWSYSNMASWGEDLDCVIVYLDTTLSSIADEVVQLNSDHHWPVAVESFGCIGMVSTVFDHWHNLLP